jgi:hypothetical protein
MMARMNLFVGNDIYVDYHPAPASLTDTFNVDDAFVNMLIKCNAGFAGTYKDGSWGLNGITIHSKTDFEAIATLLKLTNKVFIHDNTSVYPEFWKVFLPRLRHVRLYGGNLGYCEYFDPECKVELDWTILSRLTTLKCQVEIGYIDEDDDGVIDLSTCQFKCLDTFPSCLMVLPPTCIHLGIYHRKISVRYAQHLIETGFKGTLECCDIDGEAVKLLNNSIHLILRHKNNVL